MITFVSHNHEDDGKPDTVLGTAELKGGKLIASTPGIQQVIDGKAAALAMDGAKAYKFFASWSNGYVGSHEGR